MRAPRAYIKWLAGLVASGTLAMDSGVFKLLSRPDVDRVIKLAVRMMTRD
jgi:hypothetical protein